MAMTDYDRRLAYLLSQAGTIFKIIVITIADHRKVPCYEG